MQCPKCRAEVTQQTQFCWQCGATLASPPAAAPQAVPGQTGGNRWIAVAAGLAAVVLLLLVLLAVTSRSRSRSVTARGADGSAAGKVSATAPNAGSAPVTAVAPGNAPGAGAVTSTAPGNVPAGSPLTATPPANLPVGAGVQRGTAPTTEPFAEDVAAYLRKLEQIQFRDSQNPMAQLFAMMTSGLSSVGEMMKGMSGEGVGEAPAGGTTDYQRTFDQMLQAKAGLVREFGAISPVPQPCQTLHRAYGAYLDAQYRAVRDLRNAVAQGNNPGAPLAALPAGKVAESAQAVASREEDAIRQRYRIPRNAMPITP